MIKNANFQRCMDEMILVGHLVDQRERGGFEAIKLYNSVQQSVVVCLAHLHNQSVEFQFFFF